MERTEGEDLEQQAWGRLERVGASAESAHSLLLVNKECTVGRRKGECVLLLLLSSSITLFCYSDTLLLLSHIIIVLC